MADEELLLRLLGERLQLDAQQQARARSVYGSCWELLRDASSSGSLLQGEAGEDAWHPCIAWLIRSVPALLGQPTGAERGGAPGAGLPLSDMLAACNINLVSFFKELPVVLNKLRPHLSELAGGAQAVEDALSLREWQETLVSLTHLSNKYKDLFWHVHRSVPDLPEQPLLRAGWLAFLLVKAQLLPGFPDLVSCLELLVCVLNLLVASIPFTEEQLASLLAASPGAIEGSPGRLSTLKLLCMEAKVDYQKAKALMPQIEAACRGLLASTQLAWLPRPLPEPAPHPQAAQLDTSCGLHLEGLVAEPQRLGELVLALDLAYERFYQLQGEIDEREFLLTDFGALASPRAAPTAMAGSSGGGGGAAAAGGAAAPVAPPWRAAAMAPAPASAPVAPASAPAAAAAAAAAAALASLAAASATAHAAANPSKPPLAPGGRRPIALGLQSPLPLMHLGPPGPATPISAAMGSVAWLRGLTQSLPLEPPPSLERIMGAAGPDAGRVLVGRVQDAAAAVFLPEATPGAKEAALRGFPELQQGVAQERRDEGVRLYWHVLQAMLSAEEARAGLGAAGQLLLRWPFHQCLLACTFELVAASYRMGALTFPAIPGRLGLGPFDLSKMIGPFVRAEPTLPRELKRHMFLVEERILESLGWAPGSSFYGLVRAATGQQQPQAAAAAAAGGGGGGGRRSPPLAASGEEGGDSAAPAGGEGGAGRERRESTPGASCGGGGPQGSRKRAASGSGGGGDDADAEAALAPKRHRSQDGGAPPPPPPPPDGGDKAPLPQALGPPGSPPPGGDPSAQAVLQDYCRKVLKLAAFRLVAVSDGLDFTPMERDDVVAAVHEVVAFALYHHTRLFYSRHLDTLLLASLYGYCKVNRLHQITFREIITHYRRQAHAKQEAFRTVVLAQSDPGLVPQTTGDIIAFYNAVFVPALKGFLLTTVQQQGSGGAGAVAGGGSGGLQRAASGGGATSRQASGELAAGAAGGVHSGDSDRSLPAAGSVEGLQRGSGSSGNGGRAKSPVVAALLHAAAQQQQQQQRSWGSAAAAGGLHGGGGAGGGGAYRALHLSGGGLPLGGSLAGLAGAPGAPGGGYTAGPALLGSGGGVGLAPPDQGLAVGGGGAAGWADVAGPAAGVAGMTAAAPPHMLARPASGKPAVAATAGGGAMQAAVAAAVPSRLSRLSRPCGSSSLASAGAPFGGKAVADAPPQGVPAAAGGGGAASGDAEQQHDQGANAAAAAGPEQAPPQRAAAAQHLDGTGVRRPSGSGGGGGSPASLAARVGALDTSGDGGPADRSQLAATPQQAAVVQEKP